MHPGCTQIYTRRPVVLLATVIILGSSMSLIVRWYRRHPYYTESVGKDVYCRSMHISSLIDVGLARRRWRWWRLFGRYKRGMNFECTVEELLVRTRRTRRQHTRPVRVPRVLAVVVLITIRVGIQGHDSARMSWRLPPCFGLRAWRGEQRHYDGHQHM